MIRIIGDSYSDDAYRVEGFTNTWVHVLAREFEIENCAVRGCANLDMLHKQARDYTGPAIVNLSALIRRPRQPFPLSWNDSVANIYKLNTNAARKMIAQMPTAYFWSPFLDYKTWSEDDFIPLEWGNTMYDTTAQEPLTVNFGKATVQDAGNHLTAEAHSWLVDHMSAVINKMILEK